jgi:hypothetical protein
MQIQIGLGKSKQLDWRKPNYFQHNKGVYPLKMRKYLLITMKR